MDGDGDGDQLTLADWRREVATLYTEIRRRSIDDVPAAWDLWRTVRERLYREHPQSPVPAADRAAFRAHHWPYDPGYRFAVPVEPPPPPPPGITPLGGLTLPNSGDAVLSFRQIGQVAIPLPDAPRPVTLSLFWMAGYAGGLFLAFRDATNGQETYGAGRYLLDSAKSADLGGDSENRTLVLDFNFSFQPSCAFDPRWACPLAPPENRIDAPIRAGERLTA